MDVLNNTRKEYEQNAKNQMEQWEADLEEITKKSKLANSVETDAEFDHQIKELSTMLLISKERVKALLDSSSSTWENEKVNFEKHWGHTALTFYKVKKKLPN